MSPLRTSRRFRRLWLAGLLSMTGSQASRMGLVLYLVREGHSALDLALLLTLDTLPGALAAPLAGVAVDRFSKRSVMVASDVARAAFVGAIFLSPSLPVVYVMTALHSVAAAFFQPAKAAALPLTVSRDDLPRANAWDQSASSLMLVAGPVLGAELLTRFGLGATLLVDALSFLASAALVAGAGIAGGGGARAPLALGGVLADVGAGWRYVRGHAVALHLYLLFFVSLLCTSLWMPLAPFFVRDYLHAPERVLGWQFAAFGAGAVAGGLWAPQPVSRFGKGATLFAALVAEGSCLTLYALVPHAGLSVALMVAWGFMVSLIVVPFYSILQTVVDERFAGRVFSLVKQSENVAIVLAMGLAAVLQDRIASHAILLLAGLLYLLLAATSSLTGGGRRLLATR